MKKVKKEKSKYKTQHYHCLDILTYWAFGKVSILMSGKKQRPLSLNQIAY